MKLKKIFVMKVTKAFFAFKRKNREHILIIFSHTLCV